MSTKKVFASKSEERRHKFLTKLKTEAAPKPAMTVDIPLREVFAQMDQLCLAVEECCKLHKLADFESLAAKAETVRKLVHGVGTVLNVYSTK